MESSRVWATLSHTNDPPPAIRCHLVSQPVMANFVGPYTVKTQLRFGVGVNAARVGGCNVLFVCAHYTAK